MNLYRQRSNTECGPVAIYNLARLLQLESARGGYRANFAYFADATRYDPRRGCQRKDTWRAARAELVGTPHKLIKRRPSWRNVVNHLDRASPPSTICILGWCADGKNHRCHKVVAWRDYDRNGIWVANAVAHRAVVPFYLRQGCYWATNYHPTAFPGYHQMLDFWQVVPRGT